jgi:SAM-dependent methyltransferase
MNEKKPASANKDITGMALKSYLAGERDKTFVRRDDGFVDREPIERYFKEYDEWSGIERDLLDGKVRGGVLETGCSIGKHLSYLQRKGFDAAGAEISAGAVRIAKELGVKYCYCVDARDMLFDRKFDTVLMLYYGFGLGGTFDGQVKFLNRLYELTSDGGQIIASSIDACKTDNPIHIAYQDYNKSKGKDYGDTTQVTLRLEHNGRVGAWYDLLFVNPAGLQELVGQTDWKVEAVLPEKEGGRAWYYILVK